ncbi:MAG TPA: teichoic acid transporter, partial [Bacteroidota bacterium]|nr:teichoic acid transporter [Bacteroidota bacterium]
MSKFIRNLVGFSLSSWIGFFVGIISVPLLTRILEPFQFALLNQFLAASNLAMAIVCLGMDSAFVRFYNEPPAGFTPELLLGKILSIIFLLLIIISLL